ncbi:MAG TPA: universal stress protein [Terriglobales bacterium]|nr:universal stress protein [Terriglobales bacterium]
METGRTADRRLHRVLLATDRSAASRAALLAVAGLAAGGGTEVVVLHVSDRGRPEEGERLAGEIACGLLALAVNARSELRRARPGGVAAEIAAAAREHSSDLVVLGSRGRFDLGGLLPGSVSREVVERVSCPVLKVRAGRRAAGRRRRVLLAMAGDEDVGDLVLVTAAIADRDARVLVLLVRAPGDRDLELTRSEGLVERVVVGLRRCGVRSRGRVGAAAHETAEEIARDALGYGADLVVMGSRRLPAQTAMLIAALREGDSTQEEGRR